MFANIVSVDFQTMRIRIILAKGYSKKEIYIAKLVVCSIFAICIFLFSKFILFWAATIFWGFDSNGIFNILGLLIYIICYILLIIAFSSVFVALAFLGRSTGRAVMNNILFLFVFPMMLTLLSAYQGQYLI